MNLHKSLLIALFAIGAQSINAGILFYDDAEIEAKKSDSYEIDPIAGTVTAEFKHNYQTRKNMLSFGQGAYIMPAVVGIYTTIGAAVCAVFNYSLLRSGLTESNRWSFTNGTSGLSQYGLEYCQGTLSDLEKSLIVASVAAITTCFCWYKAEQVEKKIEKLPKEERVTVASIVQK
jgi:hypothetical protein